MVFGLQRKGSESIKITTNLRILLGIKLCYGAISLEIRDQFHGVPTYMWAEMYIPN